MKKQILTAAASFGIAALLISPAFAETSTSSPSRTSSNIPAKIACIGAAVNARETTLNTALSTFNDASSAAHTARTTALQQSYSATDLKTVRAGVKAAWSGYTTAERAARKAHESARSAAWSKYRTAALACKAPSGVGDGSNADSDM